MNLALPQDNRMVAALLEEPAILMLSPTLLAGDVMQRFGCSKRLAYLAVMEAYRAAPDDSATFPIPPARRSL